MDHWQPFQELPDEVIFQIFSYCEFEDLRQLVLVSNQFHDIAKEVVKKKCPSLIFRLDLYFPPDELPEGVMVLNYNKKKRNRVSDHVHKEFRKVKLIKRGITDSVLRKYPTCDLSDLGLFFSGMIRNPDGENLKSDEIVIDMTW